ncbi:MAG: histidine phosphatase family protein [Bifidobacteriaceae bacterium]|jgi:probable phosphoglycerate mutase|nr:histidine phosphatase family protein [Bifidobacteriaceae bacterium]
MTAKQLVIWRHGQTAHNLEGRIQGSSDVPLDTAGKQQVADAARRLALLAPAALWSSDLRRARATGRALADLVGLPVQTDARLREREFGQWEGQSVADISERWPDEFQRWRAGQDIPSVGMETRGHAAKRMVDCIQTAAEAAPDGSTIVIATHGGVAVCGITGLLDLDPVEWLGLRVMRNAHWAVLEAGRSRRPAWRLTGYDLGAPDGRPGMTPWA